MKELVAHSANQSGKWHGLREHLDAVAQGAADFSAVWGDSVWARLAGAWHDLGKARPGFQRHLEQDADAHIEARVQSAEKTHSAAGALHARREFARQLDGQSADRLSRVLQYLIAGHHAGLDDWHPSEYSGGLSARLHSAPAQTEYDQTLKGLTAGGLVPLPAPQAHELTAAARELLGQREPLSRALALRMLFSALVDADFLDTESHINPDQAARRNNYSPIARYADQLAAHLQALQARVRASGQADTPVMQARARVQASCLAQAAHRPGVFTLTVPTGGGKTLSSLAFALEHARHHGLRRVVYAIPYTSIIEQTAGVFVDIFGRDAIIEHHSQSEASDRAETSASRLACENWDAPLIVTTNVQLFESLFASRTSRCRKLHRLAGSVIVLDEAQMLPPEFLQPILDALNVLLTRYRISLVLCTATQPVLTDRTAFDPRKSLRGLPPPRAIVEQPQGLFDALRRTEVRWPKDLHTPVELPTLAESLRREPCALVIVNTRRDAIDLARLLPAETTQHLSAAMCGAHRAQVIEGIRTQLAARAAGSDQPFHLVSTQLIEAGVDVDFPVVFRALAGLDSIAQAAGRCNREGRLAAGLGQVHVFVRQIPRPLALLRSAAETTVSLLAEGLPDALAPEAFERYFRAFYARQPSHDRHGIVELLSDRDGPLEFSFRSAAAKFKLIDDDGQVGLLIPLHKLLPGHEHLEPLIKKLETGDVDRWLLRSVQRYVLNIRQRQFDELLRTGAVQPLACGLHLLTDEARYDRRFGLLPSADPLDAATLVQ